MALVAGLHWVPLTKGERSKLFSAARAEDEHSYCITPDGTQIGFFSSNPGGHGKGRGALVSLALLLGQNYSHGGEEIFAFHVDTRRSCVVVLRDGQPVPGFDVIGNTEVVSERINTFLQLTDSGSVRRVGAVDLLGNVEEIDWDLVLDEVTAKVRLKKIPDIRKMLVLLAVSAVVFVVGFGAVTYKLARDKKLADEQARIASDPNIVYENKIDVDLAAVTGIGQISLQRMVGGLKQIPLQIKGWRLSKVECTPALCNASWIRSYGNFSEFGHALPPSAMGQPQYDVFSPDDLTSAQLVTQHRLDNAAAVVPPPPKLTRAALPLRSTVSSKFFSTLQDLSMMDIKVKVEPAQLFAGQGDVNQLVRPVVNAVWAIEGPLWTMEDIVLEDYVAIDSITVELDTDKTVAPIEKTRYKLSGKYYAKGKDF
ncbi:type 4b pilus protein PilO2 [Herbaspirillum frisingense]|uniref:type 4b pilus protein PilO2 n=1 Tax=Herbaspirillum frisingense TaxID=92645 RepID=UPI001603271C|nr:type 4b pilus protein PilO2 [Herbaspirillum frisingense]QNB08159.1 type 4b pilus protein PilO2 [Herbaspirillum frisingense]